MAINARDRGKRRRVGRRLAPAYANAVLWGVGSGLASTTLVLFLAYEYEASGLAIAWLLAAPSLAGMLRLLTPAWLERVGSRRRFCVGVLLASAAVLATLPVLSAPGVLPSRNAALVALGAAWAGYQTLEAVGVVALWSWFGDLVPERVRGRFIGRREAWLNAGIVGGTVIAAVATAGWSRYCERIGALEREWQAFAACGLAGAVLFALAAVALQWLPEAPRAAHSRPHVGWRDVVAPWMDSRFRRFLAFGLWFSISNGIVQTAQSVFLIGPLQFSLAAKKSLDGASRGLQAILLPRIGAAIDRRGNVPVLTVCQAIIAAAPLFLLCATPAQPWWALGAYGCWLAYGGHNVAFPNLMLGLSPADARPTYTAAWFAWTQLAFSISVLAGGAALDALATHFGGVSRANRPLEAFAALFAASCLLKAIGVWWARRIPEPAAAQASLSAAN